MLYLDKRVDWIPVRYAMHLAAIVTFSLSFAKNRQTRMRSIKCSRYRQFCLSQYVRTTFQCIVRRSTMRQPKALRKAIERASATSALQVRKISSIDPTRALADVERESNRRRDATTCVVCVGDRRRRKRWSRRRGGRRRSPHSAVARRPVRPPSNNPRRAAFQRRGCL